MLFILIGCNVKTNALRKTTINHYKERTVNMFIISAEMYVDFFNFDYQCTDITKFGTYPMNFKINKRIKSDLSNRFNEVRV